MATLRAPLKVIRIITRLNVGGPAHQAITLTARLRDERFTSLLVTGQCDAREGNLQGLCEQDGVHLRRIPELRRPIHPWRDTVALCKLIRLFWKERPAIVHTHMAKAGTLGRLATMAYNTLGPGRRLGARAAHVHTFHGHVLDGYFAPWLTQVFVIIERWLSHWTDRFIAVSPAIRDVLLEKGIGRPAQWRVIPLGLDLTALTALPFSERCGQLSVGMVGRLVPIKNPSLFLNAISRMAQQQPAPRVRGIIVGDGPLRPTLEQQAARMALGETVRFVGWQHDLRAVYEGIDVACLTSWNEGTPVSLIEAMAAGRAVVATDVGGVRDLLDGSARTTEPIGQGAYRIARQGILIKPGDADGLVKALTVLSADAGLRRQLGETARTYVSARYTTERLVQDIRALYEECRGGTQG